MDESLAPATRSMPQEGVWRIGRGSDPLVIRVPKPGTLDNAMSGNRFDSPDGTYGVLYFATDLTGCCGETLARFRPSPAMRHLIEHEWRERGFMEIGAVPQEWRLRRTAVQVQVDPGWQFLDVETHQTVEYLRRVLALGLSALEVDDLDISDIRGKDRRVTRLISNWAFHATDDEGAPRYAGIRYQSRLDSGWECWAVFHDVDLLPVGTRPLLKRTRELLDVAQAFGLTIH